MSAVQAVVAINIIPISVGPTMSKLQLPRFPRFIEYLEADQDKIPSTSGLCPGFVVEDAYSMATPAQIYPKSLTSPSHPNFEACAQPDLTLICIVERYA